MSNGKTIGITGASGALGKELTKLFRQKGYRVIGFTHTKTNTEIKLNKADLTKYLLSCLIKYSSSHILFFCLFLYSSP